MVRLAADGAGDSDIRGASPSMVESDSDLAENCIIVTSVISRATYALFSFFLLSMALGC